MDPRVKLNKRRRVNGGRQFTFDSVNSYDSSAHEKLKNPTDDIHNFVMYANTNDLSEYIFQDVYRQETHEECQTLGLHKYVDGIVINIAANILTREEKLPNHTHMYWYLLTTFLEKFCFESENNYFRKSILVCICLHESNMVRDYVAQAALAYRNYCDKQT